jgi:hypothetical protein
MERLLDFVDSILITNSWVGWLAGCTAENPLLPAVAVLDAWNITLHCKF